MARPIKATPRLSGKAAHDFRRDLERNADRKAVIDVREPGPELKRKILDEALEW